MCGNNLTDIELSKKLSYILRHNPSHIDLYVDNEGWANCYELIEKLNNDDVVISMARLKEIVQTNSKQRFVLSNDFSKIRANQGHSINIDLKLMPSTPPDILFHGTSISNIESIKKTGIQKQNRQFVHLSENEANAITVGSRHGKPIVLKINAKDMHKDEYAFVLSVNNIWMTESIPTNYILNLSDSFHK